jgi:hypothetical protein
MADLPTPPSLPSPGSLINPIVGLAGDVGDWAGEKIGKAGQGAKEMAGKIADLTGLGGVAGKIEESVDKIRNFANEQIDALLNGAASAANATAEFARETLEGARTKVESTVDQALDSAKEVVEDIEGIPGKASALLDDAKRIKQRAMERRDSIKQHKQRFRDRKAKIPKAVVQHLEEIFVELDEELDLEAAEAEKLGDKVEHDSRQFYQKTVDDAKHYGGQLVKQTEQNVRRFKKLKQDLKDGKTAAKTWASDQAKKVKNFKSARAQAAKSIGSPSAAKSWATESIEGAHKLATEIKEDVGRKPGEIKTFGQKRVDDAMELAQGIKQEVLTARDWAKTQKGNNAAWKRAMQENRNTAESFLKSQGARVAMRIATHGEAIGGLAKGLAEEQYEDTSKELGKSVADVKKTFKEVQGAIHGDKEEFAEELGKTVALHPEVEASEAHHKLDMSFGVELDADAQAGALEEPLQLEQQSPAKVKQAPAFEQKSARKTGLDQEKPKKATAEKSKPAGQPEEPQKVDSGSPKTLEQPSVAPKKSTAPATKSGIDAEKGTSQRSAPMPSAGIKPPNPPAGPVPIPFPNVEPVDSKTRKGQSIPTIPIPKKEPPKAAGGKDAEKPSSAISPEPAKGSAAKPGTPAKKQDDAGTKKTSALGEATPTAKDKAPKTLEQPKPLAQALPPVKSGEGVQKKESDRKQVEDPKAFQEQLLSVEGEGQTPTEATRRHLAPHVGFDPAMVRFHTGPAAQAAAAALSADAFTIGKNVFFGAGKFDPATPKGLGLIGHEATHVGQQMGLRGNKLQFNTKTGGDAMEQEAQEVGERIASNLSYGMGLRVGKYVRTYEPADDEPVTTAMQIKLDRLSMLALSRASRFLTMRRREKPVRLDEVLVDLSLDLEELSDSEIVDIWADAIVSAVESTRPDSPNTISESEALAPATHVLQKKLGDPGEESKPEPPKKVDPEVMARILKITPSAGDKDMIRKLLAREHVDNMIKESQRKQAMAELDDSSWSVALGLPVYLSGDIHPDDRGAIESKLKEYDIGSYGEFVKLKVEFVEAFEKKGVDIVKYMLAENLNIVLQQKKRYLSRDKAEPDAPINSIRTSAEQVKKAMDEYIATVYASLDHYHWLAIGAHSNKPNYGNLDSVTEIYMSKIDKKAQEAILGGYKRFSKVRQAHGDKHPILLGRDFNPHMILDEKNAGDLELKLFHHFEGVEKDIRYAQDGMSTDKFWELPQMVSMTRQQLGVREGEGAAKTIDETQKAKSEDAAFWAILQAAAAIALAVTAMVATGGLAAVAMVGSAGLSVYSAAKAVDDYMFKSAAVNSSLDQARLISKDEPSLFWLAVELIGAGLDVAGAVGAFGKLATIARRAMATTEAKALRELEEVARDAYKGTKGLAMSEDDFVARLLESAKKGTSGTESLVKQAKLATELLEGTSARAVAIMKGDKAAIQSLVSEYGNWKGLMGSLTNGGEDAAKMSKNIGAWRQEIVDDLAKRGAKPLDNASTEVVSDFDLNVKPLDGKGAGERVLEFEKELAGKYGPNWSDALLMNFYTDKSQLLTVEKALSAVSPQKRAAILARVTEKSEKLNFAKMLEHAGGDPAAIKQVQDLMKSAGVKYSIEDLKAIGDTVKNKGRDALLRDIDAKIKELDAMPPNSPNRISKAEEITELQMEANFLTKEAYISPSAVKGGPLTNAEAYQAALSQLEMIRHVIHECGGDILKACREYELFKYINRYAGAANKAGAQSPGLTYFENLSTYIYKRARSAHAETGHLPGVTPADEALESAVDAKWLLDQYNMFRKEVDSSLPKMRQAADKNPGGGWKPDGAPKTGPPAAGKPAGAPGPSAAPSGPSGPQNLYTPQPPDLKKGAALPAAAVATAKAVDKMMDKDGKKPTAAVGPQNAVQSAGFSSSKAKEGIGMFITTIPGVKNEVFVTVMSADDRAKFEQQFGAALAAEKTGFGPKVHGKIDMGKDKLAFATDVVKGGYADAYKNSGTTPDDQVSPTVGSKGEMMKNAANVTPTTFADVENYCKSIFESGFYYVGPVDGFVAPDGHWKPVNFYNAAPMSKDTVQDEAWKTHAEQFSTLKDNLMKRHLEAKGVAGKKKD